MKPLIGITARVLAEESERTASMGARSSYVESVVEAGGVPILIPLLSDKELLRDIFRRLDGLLLPGGEDVDPSLYGENPHP